MTGRKREAEDVTAARIDRLRPSRDGDQFHYWWTARRSLALLLPSTLLVVISVEGVPVVEEEEIADGVDVIDVAEYYGSKEIGTASRVLYFQLKHSTRRSSKPCKPGDLAHTVKSFARRYQALVEKFGAEDVAARIAFEYLTNRPIAPETQSALGRLREGKTDRGTAGLANAIGLTGEALFRFAKILTITGDADDYLEQRRLLDLEHVRYLPGRDEDAPVQLKEMVTRRATSEYLGRPEIDHYDVLKALGVHEGELEPADCRIERPDPFVEREAVGQIAEQIINAIGPAIVTAEGGEGKSVLAIDIGSKMPAGSVSFAYDCFGNGSYRSATGYRHRPADGLVQLANEMAAAGLCSPLIPSPKADGSAYVRAFLDRVRQASGLLTTRSPTALLCLIVDAADNAEMIAAELSDGPSFPRLLLRETWPANVRLVLLARGYRVTRLDPPPGIQVIPFGPFTLNETRANLLARKFVLTETQLAEFHRMTSRNPRVQAAVIDEGGTLVEILARLGPNPLDVDATIRAVLARAVARVRDEWVGSADRQQLNGICQALATLRPLVPIEIVARIANVPAGMVRSFVQDMGRGLIEDGDAIQFRDEPTESWFRETYKPDPTRIGAFVDQLSPLAADSAYAAASLPLLLLEANRFDELVQLAMTGGALPAEPLVRREVELQRLQFAIKASLRQQRFSEASRLALKAANEAAAQGRQQRLLAANTDLAARFIDGTALAERISRRELPGGSWTGSEHAYAAAMLSAVPALIGDASSQLRQTNQWFRKWIEAARAGTAGNQRPDAKDIAEMAMAELNLNGHAACAWALRRWRRRVVSFEAGRLLVSRLVDACRYDDIDRLARACGNDLGLILAICTELERVGRTTDRTAVRRAIRIALRPGIEIAECEGHQHENARLPAVTALVIAAALQRAAPDTALAELLGRYIKRSRRYFSTRLPSGADDRESVLTAYTVRAVLLDRPFGAAAVARLGKGYRRQESHERDELRRELDRVLRWHRLSADVRLGRLKKRAALLRLREVEAASTSSGLDHERHSVIADAQARLWGSILLSLGKVGKEWDRLVAWSDRRERPLFIPTHAELARRAARTAGFEAVALQHADTAFRLGTAEHDHADQTAEMCVTLARATLPASGHDARAYFDKAVEASDKIGDENVWRFETLLYVADIGSSDENDDPETAYRLSRAGELTYALVARDKHFDYWHALENITRLSPRSGPVVLSRWTDRRFGFHRRLLPEMLEAMRAKGALDPLDALCLLPFDADLKEVPTLRRALSATPDAADRRDQIDFATDYLRFETRPVQTWKAILDAAEQLGMDRDLIVDELERAERRGAAEKKKKQKRSREVRRPSRKLNACFAGLDISVPGDLRVAAAKVKAAVEFGAFQVLVAEAWARVTLGGEPGLLLGFAELEEFGSFGLRQLLEMVPADWNPRLAVRSALADLVRAVARRDEHAAAVVRHHAVLDWIRLTALSGVTIEEAIKLGAEALAANAIVPDAETLFTLVTRWARLLEPARAREVLQFGLDLYEPLLEPKDGDGPWRAVLEPPSSARVALAGYIWSALADPLASRRWEAAHVVRAICRLGRKELLSALVDLACNPDGQPFGAPANHFYDLHALQWLLIALWRSAAESGPVVAVHADFLRRHATKGQHHLMIRSLAAEALLELSRQSLVQLSASEGADLAELARPTPTRFASKSRPKGSYRRKRAFGEDSFLVGMDFDKYWTEPLSRMLGVSQAAVEAAMEQVVRKDWGLAFTGRWAEDARAGQFDDARGYGEIMPVADTLSRYLSYHSLHVTAGKLLESAEPDPEAQPTWDSRTYAEWFAERGLTRRDGNWLFDRRDRVPGDLVDLRKPRGDWIGSQRESDLVRQFQPMPGWLTAAADVSRYDGQDSEEISVSSALVAPDRARSLARALQVANYFEQQLPMYDNGDDIEHAGYWLKGWIGHRDHDRGLDEHDSWAGGLRASAYSPGDRYRELLGLVPQDLGRLWLRGQDTWLRSEFWSLGEDSDDMRFGRGARLLVSKGAVEGLLETTRSSLIVKVRIERGRYRTRYDRREEKKNDDSRLTRLFVVERGGGIWTPRRRHSIGPRSGPTAMV